MSRSDTVSLQEVGGAISVLRRFRASRKALVSLLVLAVAWQVASLLYPPIMVPGWERIAKAFLTLRFEFVLVSLARVVAALVISFLLGLVGAIAMYHWEHVEDYGMTVVKVVMAVPAVCWIVFSILWFKGVEFRIAFVLVTVCGPIFLIDFLDAMRGVSKELRDMAWSFRPSLTQFFVKLILPSITPVILTSWKINLSQAIRLVTFAELVGAVSGIGYGLVVAQELFSIADVFAWTLTLVVILQAAMAMLSLVERKMLRWRV